MLKLIGANLNYSSWTMRPWLALTQAQVEFQFHDVGLKTREDWKQRILAFSGAGKVPILIDGALTLHESLAICEYVAELFPAAQLWPTDAKLRARGRAISCEMLSSFQALRSAMPCNLRARTPEASHSAAVVADISRVLEIWDASLQASGGPFLFGSFSIADCMFFPVATRLRTYAVPLPDSAQRYSRALFELPAVIELEKLARAAPAIPEYDAALQASVQ